MPTLLLLEFCLFFLQEFAYSEAKHMKVEKFKNPLVLWNNPFNIFISRYIVCITENGLEFCHKIRDLGSFLLLKFPQLVTVFLFTLGFWIYFVHVFTDLPCALSFIQSLTSCPETFKKT